MSAVGLKTRQPSRSGGGCLRQSEGVTSIDAVFTAERSIFWQIFPTAYGLTRKVARQPTECQTLSPHLFKNLA